MYLRPNKDLSKGRKEIDQVCEILETNYVDTFQVSHPSFYINSYQEIVTYVKELLSSRKARSTSITNANLELLKKYYESFNDNIFAHECVLNFEVRANQDLGILEYAEQNKIQNVIFQPLRRNRTAKHNWPLLVELSKKYGKTQNQIILNWLMSKSYLPLFKSINQDHITENLESQNFVIEKSDLNKIDEFRVPGYKVPKINWTWDQNEKGVTIDQLSNVFDEEYRKQIC